MNPKKVLKKVLVSKTNLRFSAFVTLVEGFGFQLSRVNGSHHIYIHLDSNSTINIQNDHGDAKPYQITQFLKLVERHNLTLIGD